MVNINDAPGFDGAEVSHPRWTNHPRFLAISGPYNQGGANQVADAADRRWRSTSAGSAADFSKVEAWLRVTNNGGGDSLSGRLDRSRRAVRIPTGADGRDRSAVRPPPARRLRAGAVASGRRAWSSSVRLEPARDRSRRRSRSCRTGMALVVSEYEVVRRRQRQLRGQDRCRIAQWAIRDGKVLAGRAPDCRRGVHADGRALRRASGARRRAADLEQRDVAPAAVLRRRGR